MPKEKEIYDYMDTESLIARRDLNVRACQERFAGFTSQDRSRQLSGILSRLSNFDIFAIATFEFAFFCDFLIFHF
jgi:hypothetical protein